MKILRINIVAAMLALSSVAYAQYEPLPKLKPLSEKKMLEPVMPLEKNGRWGYANSKRKFLIKNVFDAAEPFENGVARVCLYGKWGLLAANGTFLLTPSFDEILPFDEEPYTLVRSGNKWGTINASGTILTSATYDEIGARKGFDVIVVEKDGLYGTLATDGSIDIEPIYSEIGPFNGNYAVVKSDMKVGTADSHLRPIIPTSYDDIRLFGYGLLKLTKEGHEGLCNEQGQMVLDFNYEKLRNASNRYVVTENYGKFGLLQINRRNAIDVIIKPSMDVRPDLTNLPAALLHDGNLTLVDAARYETFALPANVSTGIDPALAVPAGDDVFARRPINTKYTLFTINNSPAYILDENDNCIWAANDKLRSFALSPVSNEITVSKFEKETIQRGYMYGSQVYYTLSLDVDWPVGAADKRVSIAPLQESLAADLVENLKILADESNEPIPENPDFESAKNYFFNTFKGTAVKTIPESVDYDRRMEHSISMTFSESEVKGCVLFEFDDYFYGGGAHGTTAIHHGYYKLETGRRVSLSDMFTYEQRNKMLRIISSRPIDEEGNVIDDEDIDYATINELPDNFIIKNNVIYFQFQQYAIGPYAIGSPLLGVRLSEIR